MCEQPPAASGPLDIAGLQALIQPLFPDRTIVAARPVYGGLTNRNYRIRLSGLPGAFLLRLYTRSGAGDKEAALYQLLHGKVPLPDFLYLGCSSRAAGGRYAILRWIEATRLDRAVAVASPDQIPGLARAVGEAAARIGAFGFAGPGFLGPALQLQPTDRRLRDAFLQCLGERLFEHRAGARLGAALGDRLWSLASAHAADLDALDDAFGLVHGDFKGANILVAPSAGGWTLAAVLDWEHAFSGTPLFDVGTLFRPPVGTAPGFDCGFRRGFTEAGGELPGNWRELGRLLDLLNWVGLLDESDGPQRTLDLARQAIRHGLAAWGRAP